MLRAEGVLACLNYITSEYSGRASKIMFQHLRQKARKLKEDTYALYLAYNDPRVPWYAKLFIAVVVAYAFSPIDLIPDFIPVLGYLDDLILIPFGIVIAVKMMPPEVMAECRLKAKSMITQDKPVSRVAAVVIIGIWVVILILLGIWLVQLFAS